MKLVGQLLRGTLSGGGWAALGILAGAYLLLVIGLGRLLARERVAKAPGP